MVLRGGTHEWRGEEEDSDVEGGEGLRHGRPFGEPPGGTARGDEGCRGGYGEGVGAPGGTQVGVEEVEGGPVCQERGAGAA